MRLVNCESDQQLTFEDLVALARIDFWAFVELGFPVLHPGQDLVFAPYMDVVACLLESCAARRKQRVIINLPPRFMKSLLASILYVAWRLGVDPTAKFICISYGDDLAHKLSASTRTLMTSPVYRAIFPATVLEKKATDHLATTAGGYRYATAVGSDITGFGADEIIIDDPLQPDEAASELAKRRVRDWVQSSVLTRFNDPTHGVLILVMHRLAPDDLSGTLGANDTYFVLKLPLVAEELESFVDRRGHWLMRRPAGELLNPARMSGKELQQLKAEIAPHVFAAQYQQRPTIGGSGMLSIHRFRRYELGRAPPFELTIHSWDIGATISGKPSVCTQWGVAKDGSGRDVLYLTNVLRLRLELPEIRAAIKAEDKRHRPALIILDERGVGLGLYQELCREGYRHISRSTATSEAMERNDSLGTRPSLSKVERFGRAALTIDDGRVMIPTAAPWLEQFLNEVAAFPNVPDNDQVDSMSQLVANMDRAVNHARLNLDHRH